MCGIAGWIGSSESGVEEATMWAVAETLRHRGPDGAQVWREAGVGLVHTRLAIIDRAHGTQPMFSADGRYVVVFNGEIYNHHHLREELERLGYAFRTRSDTEVLLYLYAEYGRTMVDHLRGMFAFAIVDRLEKTVFLARDRFGKKPLYCAVRGQTLLFASTTDALARIAGQSLEIDPQSVAEYLVLQYVPSPRSPFSGVSKLAPGHAALWRRGDLEVRCYWRPPRRRGSGRPARGFTPEDLTGLRSLIRESVTLRLESEVPLGIFLSGGLDSSVVVAEAARSGITPSTFSVGFRRASYDETRYARLVAERFGTRHTELVADDEVEELFDRFTASYDEPFADSSALATLAVAGAAAEQVTVILTGDGGDEMFGGYARYGLYRRARALRSSLGPLAALAGRTAQAIGEGLGVRKLATGGRFVANPWAGYREAMFHHSTRDVATLLHPDVLDEVDLSAPIRRLDTLWAEGTGSASDLLFVDESTYLPDDLLTKMDRATMAFGLEARSPLLDHTLAEACAEYPDSWLFDRARGKRILREAYRSELPPEILDRAKMGFGVPIAAWMRKELRQRVGDLLLASKSPLWDLLRREEVTGLTRRFLRGEGSGSAARKVWNLLALAGWVAHRSRLAARPESRVS